MRSTILISLALLLSLQLASSQDLVGIWTDPLTTYDSDSVCCVPTSMTIEAMEGTSNLKATYRIPSIFDKGYNGKCGMFFNGAVGSQGTTTVYKDTQTGKYFVQKYDFYGNKNYIFTVSGGVLRVEGAGQSSPTTCKFSFNTKSTSSSGGGFIFFLILILIIGGAVGFKNHQKKQQNVIIAQNLAQNDTTIYQPQPTYVAPQQFVYAQPQPGFVAQPQPGFVAQPQMGFVAQQPQAQVGFVGQPGQPQMVVNMNMNADPNRNMNGGNVAVNVAVGGPQ